MTKEEKFGWLVFCLGVVVSPQTPSRVSSDGGSNPLRRFRLPRGNESFCVLHAHERGKSRVC